MACAISSAVRSFTAATRRATRRGHLDPSLGVLDRKIKAQVQALEHGVEPELVSERIAELRGEKEALEEALASLGADHQEAEDEDLSEQLQRLPDLGQALREAPVAVKRQVFTSFDLQIAYERSSTVSN